MKTSNHDKTLEQLENETWKEPDVNDTGLVKRVHEIRKKKLNQLTTEDLRTMIGQGFNLDLLIPLAIDILQDNILAEGDLYPGDLLSAILQSDLEFWSHNKSYWETIRTLYDKHRSVFETDNEFRQIRKRFELFEAIYP